MPARVGPASAACYPAAQARTRTLSEEVFASFYCVVVAAGCVFSHAS